MAKLFRRFLNLFSQSSMTSFLSLMLIIAAMTVLTGCGGARSAKSSGEGAYISNTRVPGDLQYIPRDNGVFFQWRPNCGTTGASRGYNFYIVPDSAVTDNFPNGILESHNGPPYPGDTNADQTMETVELRSLLNGVRYTAVVRNVFSDGSESKPSNVIHFTPMPGGEFSLLIRYKGETDGFDFAAGSAQRADNARNDLYFSSSSKGDFLSSPSKLSFGLKSTRFRKVGNFKSMLDAAGVKSSGSKSDEVKIKAGDVFEALTDDKHYARVRVVEISGSGKERTVALEYLYQTTADMDLF